PSPALRTGSPATPETSARTESSRTTRVANPFSMAVQPTPSPALSHRSRPPPDVRPLQTPPPRTAVAPPPLPPVCPWLAPPPPPSRCAQFQTPAPSLRRRQSASPAPSPALAPLDPRRIDGSKLRVPVPEDPSERKSLGPITLSGVPPRLPAFSPQSLFESADIEHGCESVDARERQGGSERSGRAVPRLRTPVAGTGNVGGGW